MHWLLSLTLVSLSPQSGHPPGEVIVPAVTVGYALEERDCVEAARIWREVTEISSGALTAMRTECVPIAEAEALALAETQVWAEPLGYEGGMRMDLEGYDVADEIDRAENQEAPE